MARTPDEARRVHVDDQTKQALEDHASQMAHFFITLTKNGFTRVEALQLTMNWQSSMLRNIGGKTGDDAA